jgi:hypothetical protein
VNCIRFFNHDASRASSSQFASEIGDADQSQSLFPIIYSVPYDQPTETKTATIYEKPFESHGESRSTLFISS